MTGMTGKPPDDPWGTDEMNCMNEEQARAYVLHVLQQIRGIGEAYESATRGTRQFWMHTQWDRLSITIPLPYSAHVDDEFLAEIDALWQQGAQDGDA